jgi:hypothetical protein
MGAWFIAKELGLTVAMNIVCSSNRRETKTQTKPKFLRRRLLSLWEEGILGLGATRCGSPQLGLKAQQIGDANWWHSTLADSEHLFVSTIPDDLERILRWDWFHWKLLEIIFPPIKNDAIRLRMQLRRRFYYGLLLDSEVDSNLVYLSLHLEDLRWISLGPDLEKLVVLLLLHSMHHSWTYALVPCSDALIRAYPDDEQESHPCSRLGRTLKMARMARPSKEGWHNWVGIGDDEDV